jgi:transmembrane sensor
MKRSSVHAAALPSEAAQTLFDRYREAGLGKHVAGLLQDRLKAQKRRRRTALKRTAAALFVIGALLWAVPYYRDTGSITVPVATQSQLTLADGSKVELTATAALQTDFRYGRRTVHLDHGEVFFSVAHDAQHPFLVETPAGTVRVTGTKFNVRLEPDGHAAVTLVEGHVIAASEQHPDVPLDPGQQLALGTLKPTALTSAEMDRALAWRDGKIILDGVTLGEAASRFAEFHGCSIQVEPAAARLKLGGTYSLKNLARFLEELKSLGSVQIIANQDGSYRILAR